MKIFVFGAGASQGSQEGSSVPDDKKAPLVDELFSPQYRTSTVFLSDEEFAECRQGTLDCGSVEQWLSERWERVESLKEEWNKFAERALFGKLTLHLWLLLQGISDTYTDANGYSVFLKRLRSRDEPFAFISFNYDTLLDQAVQSRFGITLLALDDYLSFGLIKPHGSVNWILPQRPTDPKIKVGAHEDVRLHVATERLFNGPPISLQDLAVYPPRPSSSSQPFLVLFSTPGAQYSYPLLFMPLTTKLYPIVSDFYERVIGKGKELLRQATQIYLIGYRAADDTIKEMFQEVKPGTAIHIVGHGSAGEVMTSVLSWATHLSQGEIHNEGFMKFADEY